MYLKNKKVLVLGFGISGLSTVKALNQLGAQIIISDSKSELELKDLFDKIQDIDMEKHLNTNELALENIDLIIKSPGILPNLPILIEAEMRNIEIITDIEFAYRISPTPNIIAITGTNGKTTCTSLIGEIFKRANFNTYVAGNIGVAVADKIINSNVEDVFIIETSSFQLEHTIYFRPKVSLITNITSDHLNWHGNIESYINAKKKIFKNQEERDFTVLNYDDKTIRNMKENINSKIIWFSVNNKLEEGIFIEDDYIVIRFKGITNKVLPYKDIKIIGKHNLENALACIGVSLAMDIELDIISEVLRDFPGVEHRLEYVRTINEISFYNDSKGTNPDSTIKAIEAVNSPIILIAGGYNKDSQFHELFQSFNGKVKEIILLGETKEKLKATALKNNFENIHLVKNMEEAVQLAYSHGVEGDNILLSPACASWDMYNSFEERGLDFKNLVHGLKED